MGKSSEQTKGNEEQTLEEVAAGAKIRVRDDGERKGISLQMNARVNHSPDAVYEVLIDPRAEKVFRSIQACTDRKVLEEDKRKGTRKLAVSHRAVSKFLFIRVTFETHLYVWEDDRERTIRFTTAREGFMKNFEGIWHVRPWSQHSLNEANAPTSQTHHHHHHPWSGVLAAAQRLLPGSNTQTSLVTLEQNLRAEKQPAPALKALVKHLVSKQLKDMMEDLRNELERRDKTKKAAQATGVPHTVTATKPALPAKAATMTGLHTLDLWQHTQPLIDVTVQL